MPKRIASASAGVLVFDLNQIGDQQGYCFVQFLFASERERYASFSRPQRRRQFLLCRMLLRFAVSRSVDIPVDRIVVAERRADAPAILNSHCRDLSFSLSHA